jgi:DNA-binding transcriptional MerR regulator
MLALIMMFFKLSSDWTGTAAQLAEVLAELLPHYALNPEPIPSERLVRFYVTSGVLQRPQREGREALFGQRQAIEFLAARTLLEDGWPLAKVGEYLSMQTDEALVALLPQRATKKTKAQELVERFQQGGIAPPPPAPIPVPAPNPVALKQRQGVREAQRELATEGVVREVRLRLTLTPWCEVSLVQTALESVTAEQVESAAELFRAALRGELARKGRIR